MLVAYKIFVSVAYAAEKVAYAEVTLHNVMNRSSPGATIIRQFRVGKGVVCLLYLPNERLYEPQPRANEITSYDLCLIVDMPL
jgi:hypothetical protein